MVGACDRGMRTKRLSHFLTKIKLKAKKEDEMMNDDSGLQ
jgi:hypothetical protein